MWTYVRRHERFMLAWLSREPSRERLLELRAFHARQIGYVQHERLVHLIVLMFVALFLLLALGFFVFRPGLPSLALTGLLLPLTIAYIIHYFRLENGIQRWYDIANRLDERIDGFAEPDDE